MNGKEHADRAKELIVHYFRMVRPHFGLGERPAIESIVDHILAAAKPDTAVAVRSATSSCEPLFESGCTERKNDD